MRMTSTKKIFGSNVVNVGNLFCLKITAMMKNSHADSVVLSVVVRSDSKLPTRIVGESINNLTTMAKR